MKTSWIHLLGLTDFLEAQQSQSDLQSTSRSVDVIKKISLLEENFQTLANQGDVFNDEIKAIKSNVELVVKGLTNQIHQINVSSIFCTYSDSYKKYFRKIWMEHSHMQVHVMNIFNKEIVSMEHISSDQIKKRDSKWCSVESFWRILVTKALVFCIPYVELHAFQVECQFTNIEGRSVLKPIDWSNIGYIFPKNERERCSAPNCFSQTFKYQASTNQIEVLIIR